VLHLGGIEGRIALLEARRIVTPTAEVSRTYERKNRIGSPTGRRNVLLLEEEVVLVGAAVLVVVTELIQKQG
jgi:hypothetical protein